MSARKKFDPSVHDDNPDWTDADFAVSKPSTDLPSNVLAQFKNKGGRPRLSRPKVAVKLRMDQNTLEIYRRSGPGWQTRINETLNRAAQRIAKAERSAKQPA